MPREIQMSEPEEGPLPPASPVAKPDVKDEDRPDWLDPKFKSAQDLQKAYDELQKHLGGKTPEPAPQSEPEPEPEPDTPSTKDGLKIKSQTADEKKPDVLRDAQNEYARNGQLSATMYQQLEKVGYPRDVVDSYLAGQQALGAQYASEIMGLAGGKENYEKMIDWARSNLSKDEQQAFDSAVQGSDMAAASLAVRGLLHSYRSTPEGQVRYEGVAGGPSVAPIESRAELIEIMQSRRYKQDEAYRAKIHQRMKAGNPLKIQTKGRE